MTVVYFCIFVATGRVVFLVAECANIAIFLLESFLLG